MLPVHLAAWRTCSTRGRAVGARTLGPLHPACAESWLCSVCLVTRPLGPSTGNLGSHGAVCAVALAAVRRERRPAYGAGEVCLATVKLRRQEPRARQATGQRGTISSYKSVRTMDYFLLSSLSWGTR